MTLAELQAEKLRLEIKKLRLELTYYPVVVIGVFLGALVALGKVLQS